MNWYDYPKKQEDIDDDKRHAFSESCSIWGARPPRREPKPGSPEFKAWYKEEYNDNEDDGRIKEDCNEDCDDSKQLED